MPGLVWGGIATFVLSLVAAYSFLRMRCRRIGNPFGRHARYWALFIVLSTAAVSTAVGVLFLAASRVPAVIGVVVPGGLWLTKLPPRRDLDMQPRTWSGVLTLPFSRLYDRMGDDMQEWCDTRKRAAAPKPEWISGAVQYYWNQMSRISDQQARDQLDSWRDSIIHKIAIVRLIDLDASPARLRAALDRHPSTQHARKYNDDDLLRLAERLEVEALNELHLFLAYAYRLGYRKMLVYPYRPGAHRPEQPPQAKPAQPVSPDL
jgi:hypothetical protein